MLELTVKQGYGYVENEQEDSDSCHSCSSAFEFLCAVHEPEGADDGVSGGQHGIQCSGILL